MHKLLHAKTLRIITAVFITCGLILLSVGCSSKSATSSTTTTITKTATVTKGNLSESITGTGNLAYSNTENLAFEIAGTVEEVLVSAGDTVTKGQELVKLDTSVWDTQIKTLQKSLVTAQRNLVTKESSLAKAQRQINIKELAVKQAEIDLQTANNNLNNISVIATAQTAVNTAKANLESAQASLSIASAQGDTAAALYLSNYITSALKPMYNQAYQNLQDIKSGIGISVSSDVLLQVTTYQLRIKQSESSLEEAKIAVDDAKTAVTNAELDKSDAEQAVQDAQDALDEAKNLSPLIVAPFDGFITKVSISGGTDVQKGTVAVVIAEPNQFEAKILVVENDIFSVKLGGQATVSLDALSDITYPAKITKISPTASVSSGVVNYAVTVQLTSLQPITTTQNTTMQIPSQSATGTAPSGTAPTGRTFSGTFPGGTMPTGTPPVNAPQGTSSASQSTTGNAGTSTSNTVTGTSSATTVSLKDGLSATVEIISKQVTNVLIIPSKAITRKGQNYSVQVINGTSTETRTVTIGMTDGTNTEISSGLSEKEQITYTVSSTSSSSSTNRTNQQIVPGGGSFEIRGGF